MYKSLAQIEGDRAESALDRKALPSAEEMDQILRYEERMHRQIDWAMQRLQESQETGKTIRRFLRGFGPHSQFLQRLNLQNEGNKSFVFTMSFLKSRRSNTFLEPEPASFTVIFIMYFNSSMGLKATTIQQYLVAQAEPRSFSKTDGGVVREQVASRN